MDIVKEIASYVEARGYKEGWTSEQFTIRQILKIADELGEAVEHFDIPRSRYLGWVVGGLAHVAAPAADLFRSKTREEFECTIKDIDKLKAELCDIIIPAMVALAELGGTADDILAKAMSDVERGTNYDDR